MTRFSAARLASPNNIALVADAVSLGRRRLSSSSRHREIR
jgi:hypothetical protein